MIKWNLITNLYEHQKECINKLSKLKIGALYMEMGTGKTRTALELIKLRLEQEKVNKVLWLCPCSVKMDLQKEICKHTDVMPEEIKICGIQTLSSSVKTFFELIEYVENNEVYLIVDESNLVKNHKAVRTEAITELSNRCKYKLILNGTPITRNESDLFAQWYILDWRILGYKSYWSFSANHLVYDEKYPGKIVRTLEVPYLTSRIAPYTYQVSKEECVDLPIKTYSEHYYTLSKEQQMEYHYISDELFFSLNELNSESIYLLFSALQAIISGRHVILKSKRHFVTTPAYQDPYQNPRVVKLLEMVENITDKIIIFCKYTHEIKDLETVLKKEYGGESVVTFYGGISQKKRQESIEKFRNTARFFIANRTCAGYGLNLQFCHYELYYSNDWDYGTRSQAEDRTHRIGQDSSVHIMDICAEDTLDETIMTCLKRKQNLLEEFRGGVDKNILLQAIGGKEFGKDIS